MKLIATPFLLLLVLFSFGMAKAQQIQMPQASPAAAISQKIGLTDVKLEYSRPSVKGRKIFGTLVPYGEVWRTGANASTKITFSTPVTVEGNEVAAGTYALYAIPNKKEWTFILSDNLELWGAIGYTPESDVLRFTVPSTKSKDEYETMELSFNNMTDTGATLNLHWEKTAAGFRIETKVDQIVMDQIQQMVIDTKTDNPGLLYQAASYYYTSDKEMEQAHKWIEQSVATDPKYWTVHLKAKIEDKLGLTEEAIQSAEMSKQLADEAKNIDYVNLNDRLIKALQ
ncbi:DUF2911 domain-containing protein [Echinicola soli]|uniref:DUF2911 domain-containing protein n=1 Tax=Echinicola soli TaxID=2591634 RepID=A0A514CLB4_9BACT|nr:DUF2911 domain-containing protein [Echinicola soli]QDH80484.1 DUF2911 domain-containing protein [Echinicola soli]